MKANFDARERAKEIKRQEEESLAKFEKEQEEWRERDLEDWCTVKRQELGQIYGRMKERTKLLNSMKDRKSMAAQQRMKNIADLANDETGDLNFERIKKKTS